jgi:hypothetical protein
MQGVQYLAFALKINLYFFYLLILILCHDNVVINIIWMKANNKVSLLYAAKMKLLLGHEYNGVGPSL